MDCKRIEELLVDYLYQELPPEQVAPFEAHVKGCSRCAAEVQSLSQTRSLVRDLPEVEPPSAVDRFLIQEAKRNVPTKAPGFFQRLRQMTRVFVMHPALAAATALVLVLGISFVVSRQGLPPSRSTAESDVPLGLEQAAPATLSVKAQNRVADEEAQGLAPAGATAGAADVHAQLVARHNTAAQEGYADKYKGTAVRKAARARRTRSLEPLAEKERLVLNGLTGNRVAKDEAPAAVAPRAARKRDYASEMKRPAVRKKTAAAPTPKSVAKPVTLASQTKSPQPRQQQVLRQETQRRVKNLGDVGSGGSSIWGNKYRSAGAGKYSSRSAPLPKAKPKRVAKGGLKGPRPNADLLLDDFDQPSQKQQKKTGKNKAVDQGRVLLAQGTLYVKKGKCDLALARFDQAVRQSPRLAQLVLYRLGHCAKYLGGKGKKNRYPVLASRIALERKRKAMRDSKLANQAPAGGGSKEKIKAAPRRKVRAKPAKRKATSAY